MSEYAHRGDAYYRHDRYDGGPYGGAHAFGDLKPPGEDGTGWVATAAAYAGAYMCIMFGMLCIMAGVYYACDLVEENTAIAKRAVALAIQVTAGVQVALLVLDGAPPAASLVGLLACACYWLLMRRFPEIDVLSPPGVCGVAATLVQSYLWLAHFFEETTRSVEYALGFLIATAWLVPAALLVSLTSNEFALPGTRYAGENVHGGGGTGGGGGGGGVLKRGLDAVRASLPGAAGGDGKAQHSA